MQSDVESRTSRLQADVDSQRSSRAAARRSVMGTRRKKKRKTNLDSYNLKCRNYVSSFDKQLLYQDITKQFAEWMTWQKRLLLCNLTEKTTSSLLTTLSTVLEPIFHRDFEIKSKNGFHSSLIKTFLEKDSTLLPPIKNTSVPHEEYKRSPNSSPIPDDNVPTRRRVSEYPQVFSTPFPEDSSTPTSMNSSYLPVTPPTSEKSSPRTLSAYKAKMFSVATLGALGKKHSVGKNIQKRLSQTPLLSSQQSDVNVSCVDESRRLLCRGTSHSHVTHRNSSSLCTAEFLQSNHKQKQQRLGGLVKPTHNKHSATCVPRQYKHEKWWLPQIETKQTFRQVSKGNLLHSFKESANNFIKQYISWSNAEKGDFMLHIVDYCSPEEINFFANCIFQKLDKISNIHTMTDDILLNIFDYLTPHDLTQSERVCQRWKDLFSSEFIWKSKCFELACKHSQNDIVIGLEHCQIEIDWRQIYNELRDSITSLQLYEPPPSPISILVNEMEKSGVEEDEIESADSVVEGSSIDAKSVVVLDDIADGEEELHCCIDDSKAKLFPSHVSFASAPNDGMLSIVESQSKDCVDDEYSKEEDAHTMAGSMSQVAIKENQRKQEEEEDVAFDVRVRLVQAPNRIKEKVVKLTQCPDDHPDDYQLTQVNNIKSVNRVRKLEGHNDAVLCLQFDSKRVMTGSADRTVRLWDIRSGRHFHSLIGHQGGVRCLKFDDKYIITGSWDTIVMIWDVINFELLCVLTEHFNCISCIDIESEFLITASHDTTVCVFKKHTWQLLEKLEAHTAPVSCMCLVAPNQLLTGSHDRILIVWDLNDYSILRKFEGLPYPCLCVKVCGSLVAAGASDGSITFWNYLTSESEGCIVAHDGPVNALCFVESRFFSAGGDDVVKEWDLATCTCLRSLRGHTGPVLCLRASSKRVVSGSADGTSRIWDMTCKLQQVGRDYDELNKSIIPTQVLNEQQFKKITLAK